MRVPYRYQFVNYSDDFYADNLQRWSDRSDEIVEFVETNNIKYLTIRRHSGGEFIEVYTLDDVTLLKLTFGVETLA